MRDDVWGDRRHVGDARFRTEVVERHAQPKAKPMAKDDRPELTRRSSSAREAIRSPSERT